MDGPECLICGESTHYDGMQHFRRTTRWFRCEICDFAQVDPMPSMEVLSDYYASGKYRREVLDTTDRAHVSSQTITAQDRDAIERRIGYWLPHIRDAERHLDIGSAWGRTLERVAQHRQIGESIGLEPGPWGESYGALKSINQAKGTFDLITCFHVLEHAPDPMEFLRQIQPLATGQVCVAVPLPGSRYWPHVTDFSIRALQKAMGLAGLPAKLVGMSAELMALHDKELHTRKAST
ncbi:MAG: class I SAM-dependent methyltransferase [Anaerolineales bacterium]